ncbi:MULTISPECIES: helix-turn-helix domain-containing protein [Neobacillus]|uniref:helix-turn-helix domain-containing protein n=1 Tax=Neobacillus TaxID=2675232 RepID=UPI001F21D3BA|nr:MULTISPECIES: helix-turn-helix domain-containing protein [Neobacillus]MED3623230.1 helix-turn-helix domain-containing protein [Neobacillus thermocopriae]MED3714408.1 helix-turn-helix domain-containing protein [Neobacillus thermocopriae]
MKLEDYPEIMTAAHISEYLHISRRRVYELLQLSPSQGGIPCIQIGLSKRVKKDSLIAWLNSREKEVV